MKTVVIDGKAKATIVAVAGAIFYAGWIMSAAHFDIAGHWKHDKAVAVAVPVLAAQVKQAEKACEKNASTALNNDADVNDLTKCPKLVKAPAVQSLLIAK